MRGGTFRCLSLSKEELALQQEELDAAVEDYKQTAMQLEEEKAHHREDVSNLNIQVKEAEMATKTSLGEAAMVASTVREALFRLSAQGLVNFQEQRGFRVPEKSPVLLAELTHVRILLEAEGAALSIRNGGNDTN